MRNGPGAGFGATSRGISQDRTAAFDCVEAGAGGRAEHGNRRITRDDCSAEVRRAQADACA
jgi:hypothetical protein